LTAAKRLLERASHAEAGAQQDRARVVILMTDGEDHEGDPVAAAKELAELGARVFVVGLGSRSGEPIPTYANDGTWTGYVRDEAGNPVVSALTADNEKQLQEIASVSNGKYIRAGTGSVGMEAIRVEMRRMKQAELEARRITVHEERYALVLLVGFLLILLETLLPESVLGRRVLRRRGAA
jgi:Ca-activated chloride channel family protein